MKIIAAIIMTLVVAGCSSNSLETINIDNINEKIEKKDDFKLYVGSSECPSCAFLEDDLIEISSEHKVDVYKLDVSDFQVNSEEIGTIEAMIEDDLTLPVTLIYEEGSLKRTIRGAQTKDTMVKLMLEE